MDRSRFGFGEYLTADTTAPDTNDDKLNRAFDRVEASADERMLDVITHGVVSGMEVTEAAVPNMTIRVLAGIAYDQTGRRLEIPSTQSIDPLTDFGGSPIALPDSGKEKYSSIYIKSSRLNQESTQDSNSVQYYQSELEHFVIRVRGGSQAPAGTATPPALVGDEILLADILLVNGMTTITDGDIDLTTRRQTSANVGALDETALQHTNGAETFAGAVAPPVDSDLQTWLRQLVTDLGKTTATTGAQRIGHIALGNYADASSGPSAGGIGGQLSSWFTAMSASGATAKLGSASLSGSPTNVGSGTLLQTLQALLNAINDRARLAAGETVSGAWTFSTAPTFGGGLWPLVDSRTVYREVPLVVAACSTDSGSNDATVKKSDLTATIHSLTYYGNMIETSLDNAGGRWHMIEVTRPLDGNVLAAVELETKVSATGGGAVTQAQYDVVRYKVGPGGMTMASLLSGSLVTDDHTTPTNGNVRTQTVTCDQNNTIDASQWRYALVVQNPYNDDAKLRIYEVRAKYTATSLRAA